MIVFHGFIIIQNYLEKILTENGFKLNEKKKIEMYIKEMDKNCKKIKNKYFFVYENLIKDPNKEINKLCKFLNLKKNIKNK